jgi:hypothetical protein
VTPKYTDESVNKVDRSHITALRRNFRALRFFTMRSIHSVLNNFSNSYIFCGSKGDAQKYAPESNYMRDGTNFTSFRKFNPNQTMRAIKSAKIRPSATTTQRLHSISGKYAAISGKSIS